VSKERWLKRALGEMGPVPGLPAEYLPSRPGTLGVTYFVLLFLVSPLCGILLGWRMAIGILLVGCLIAFVAAYLHLSWSGRTWARTIGERLVFEGPATGRQTLDAVLPDVQKVARLPAFDFLLEAMSHLEAWAGEHERASRLCRVALSRLPDPPNVRRVGSLVRSIVEALALDGQVEEARKWLDWGQRHCPTEFAGNDWLTCTILFARQGEVQQALASLEREPDPLSTPARGQLVARAMRAFLSGVSEPLPLQEVRYLGSHWPELARYLDDVERGMRATEKASA
jgi:hypothetical protein